MHQPIEIVPAANGRTTAAGREETKISPMKRLYRRINRLAERSSRSFSVVAVMRCHPRTMLLAVTLSGLLLAGCKVGPNYSRPAVAAQAGWKEEHIATNITLLPSEWWQIFGDQELNALETQAVKANQDLARAVAHVTEARALARVSASELYPSISANGAYTRYRFSENRGIPLQETEADDFTGSFDLSYELDVWGRIRRSVEAARAEAGAAATDLEVVLLTLTADVARNYYLIRSLDNEKRVVEATIELRRDAVRLQETRNQAGLINEVDVTRARTELANVEAELHAIQRSRGQVEHALAVLCGEAPGSFSVAALASSVPVPEVPVGLPSTLLQRRPDLVEAEQFLEASSARIGVAKAAFFPTIKLTSTAGLASADLGTFLNWQSRAASIGPSIHVPIFEGGRNRANLAAAEARYEQSVASYRGAVLNAFREVEDALSDLGSLSSQSAAVNRALVSARDTAALANERYQRGLSSYLDVVDAQRIALQAERQEAQLRGQRAISTVLLVKALGGGWERASEEAALRMKNEE
jgi:multidrug efflux system outer membrane protein